MNQYTLDNVCQKAIYGYITEYCEFMRRKRYEEIICMLVCRFVISRL